MQASSARWHVVTDTELAHEREGLEHVRELLPIEARSTRGATSSLSTARANGSEVDLLVLGEGTAVPGRAEALPGRHRRQRLPVGARHRSEDSPLKKTAMKAHRLAGVLKSAAKKLGLDERTVPFVKPAVFLHARPPAACCRMPTRTICSGSTAREHQSNCRASPTCSWSRPRAADQSTNATSSVVVEAPASPYVVSGRSARGASPGLHSMRLMTGRTGRPNSASRATWPGFTSSWSPRAPRSAQAAGVRRARRARVRTHSRLRHRRASSLRRTSSRTSSERARLSVQPGGPATRPVARRQQRDAGSARADRPGQATRRVAFSTHTATVSSTEDSTRPPSSSTPGTSRGLRIGGWRVAGVSRGCGAERSGDSGRVPPGSSALLDAKRQGEADRVADAYIAPEGQWRPDASRSRLDVFALGALTYLLVDGPRPGDQRRRAEAAAGARARARPGRGPSRRSRTLCAASCLLRPTRSLASDSATSTRSWSS